MTPTYDTRGKQVVGAVHGRLTVTREVGRDTNSKIIVEAVCECGKTWTGELATLRIGRTKSCGCFKREFDTARAMTNEVYRRRIRKRKAAYLKRHGLTVLALGDNDELW